MYRLIKELPGAPVGSEVSLEDNSSLMKVYKDGWCVAYIPKADLHLWVSEDKPKGIEPIRTCLSEHKNAADVGQFVEKLNEIIAQVNKLTGV